MRDLCRRMRIISLENESSTRVEDTRQFVGIKSVSPKPSRSRWIFIAASLRLVYTENPIYFRTECINAESERTTGRLIHGMPGHLRPDLEYLLYRVLSTVNIYLKILSNLKVKNN